MRQYNPLAFARYVEVGGAVEIPYRRPGARLYASMHVIYPCLTQTGYYARIIDMFDHL